MAVDPQDRYSNEMERSNYKTFMMISNEKKTFDIHGLHKNNSALRD